MLRMPRYLVGVSVGIWSISLVACASAGLPSPGECRSDLPPHELSLTESVDSASLQSDLEKSWEPVEGLVLGWVRYDSVGSLDGVGLRTASLTEPAQDRIGTLLRSSANHDGPRSVTINLFVGDERGPAVRRVARLRSCRPEVLNKDHLARRINEVGRQLGLQTRSSVTMRVEVKEDGSIGEVRVSQSSGNQPFDLAVADVVRSAAVSPGVIEGIPVRVWIQLPFIFSHPGR